MHRSALVSALALALAAAPAAAGEPPAPVHPEGRAHAAWLAAETLRGGVLAPEHESAFMLLAWQAAAASLCPEVALDHARFGIGYARLEHADIASLSDEEHAFFRHHLAVSFGVAVGILLAELGATDETRDAACADALALRDGPAETHAFATAEEMAAGE